MLARALQRASGQARRAGEQGVALIWLESTEQAFEEVAYHAPGQLSLQFASTRHRGCVPLVHDEFDGVIEQSALADPRRALYQRNTPDPARVGAPVGCFA